MINKVFLAGNITRAELRTTAGGLNILEFGIAVNDRVKRNEQWEDKPNFFDCKMFGARAESLSRYLTKGVKVALVGKLNFEQWGADDSTKRSKVSIIVDDVEFMTKGQQTTQDDVADDDIPF